MIKDEVLHQKLFHRTQIFFVLPKANYSVINIEFTFFEKKERKTE